VRYFSQIVIIGAAAIALAHSTSWPGARTVDMDEGSFAETVQKWNGTILWEPASASGNIISRFGDEARAVFGPIPDGDCSDDAAKTIPLQVDGNIVDLKPNPGKPDHPLEFEHRDTKGNVVKWTSGIAQCDKPSLTGSATYCGLNSRLNRVENGNVEWLFLCRKSSPSLEVEPSLIGSGQIRSLRCSARSGSTGARARSFSLTAEKTGVNSTGRKNSCRQAAVPTRTAKVVPKQKPYMIRHFR